MTRSGDGALTAEQWCAEYILASELDHKLAPPVRGKLAGGAALPELGLPKLALPELGLPSSGLRISAPGRSDSLHVVDRAEKIPKPGALREASARAKLLHVFLHHEVQAAELCAWAVLAYPDTPPAFRAGLLRICDDEIRHAAIYAARIEALGSHYGAFAVRDWFWDRTLRTTTPLQYVALMGLGFEGGNLEHAARFAEQLHAAGDSESAELVERVGREEVAHVHFAAQWFTEWTGAEVELGPDFDRWCAELVQPMTPAVLRGVPLDRERRSKAGLSEAFLDRLESFVPSSTAARKS